MAQSRAGIRRSLPCMRGRRASTGRKAPGGAEGEQTSGHFEDTQPAGAGTESDGATGARAASEIGSACGVRIAGTVNAMRFSYAEALCDPTHYLPLARAVEDAGWDTFIVPD